MRCDLEESGEVLKLSEDGLSPVEEEEVSEHVSNRVEHLDGIITHRQTLLLFSLCLALLDFLDFQGFFLRGLPFRLVDVFQDVVFPLNDQVFRLLLCFLHVALPKAEHSVQFLYFHDTFRGEDVVQNGRHGVREEGEDTGQG